LEQLLDLPVESVSGVSKYDQTIRRAPAGVTVLTAADIRNYGWRTLADALRSAPGFHIRNDRFYEYIGNRGFTRPFDYNSRTLVLVNGHRINDAIYQQGSVGSEFILDLDLVDRIEIIRGPGSSIYGSNAFYGAINIIPKKGRDISGGEVSLAAGSSPGGKARLTVGDRTPGGIVYLFSATEWESRGEDDYELPREWRAADASFTARDVRNADDMIHRSAYASAAWRGLEGELAYGRRHKDVLPPVYFTAADTPAYGVDERAYALVRATGHPTANGNFTATVSLDFYRYNGIFSPAFTNLDEQRAYADSLSLGTELIWRQTLTDHHELSFGIEHRENFQQNLGRDNLDTGQSVVRVRESSAQTSPFAQLDAELRPDLHLSVGGRYDTYGGGDQRATPRTGLIWDARDSTTFKLLYGESFRVPNVEERYASEAGLIPNPDLGPETNRTWEFITEHRLDKTWRIQSHVYYIVSEDLITTVPTGVPGQSSYSNAQEFTTFGSDLALSATYAGGIQIRASATLQQTEDEATGTNAPDAPRQLYKLNLSIPLGDRGVRASAEVQYVGPRVDAERRDAPAYLTGNLTLRTATFWRHWDLSLSIYNVADTRWTDPKNTGQIISPPRSAMLRLTYGF
jgi:iron complex outermembrane receptor protein